MRTFFSYRQTTVSTSRLALLSVLLATGSVCLADTVWLDGLPHRFAKQGWGTPQYGRSISEKPLSIAGIPFQRGIGTHAPASFSYSLDGKAKSFSCQVGVDDAAGKDNGSITLSVMVDRKIVWTSPLLRGGDPAVPVDVSLRGAKKLTLLISDGANGNATDHADLVNPMVVYEGLEPKPATYEATLTIDLNRPRQLIDNFAASDSWSIDPIGVWSESSKNKVADLLFSRDKGIGLSGWRYNLGGGLCPETIYTPWRTVTSYEVSPGNYDFSREPGKRWFLRAARDRGVEQFIAYAVTPPRRLTENGFTNCTAGKGTTNLRKGAEREFAKYLVDIAEGFGKLTNPKDRVKFTHISPINEPDFEWNGFPEKSSQEGCRYSWDDIKALSSALYSEVQRQGSTIKLVLPEAPSPGAIYARSGWMEKLYKAKYSGYAEMMERDADVYSPMKPVFAFHSYWCDRIEYMVGDRVKARKALDKISPMTIWQTEYCQMQGPRNEGGHGRDLGMSLALSVARLIHYDMTILETSAWQWWLAVSPADYKDGLIYTDFQKPGDEETIYPSKTLWCLGNFSRFIRPGYRRVWTSLPNESVEGLHGSAYVSPKGDKLVVVLVNCGSEAETINLKAEGGKLSMATPYITSDRTGDDLRKMTPVDLNKAFSVPSRAVVTLVAALNSGKTHLTAQDIQEFCGFSTSGTQIHQDK